MCTVLLSLGINPIAVNKYIYINTNFSESGFFTATVPHIIYPSHKQIYIQGYS